jgi:signal transduction histidine kinase
MAGLPWRGLAGRLPRQAAHAVRVALAATVLIGIVYAGCVAALDAVLAGRFVAQVDARLRDHLADGGRGVTGIRGIGNGTRHRPVAGGADSAGQADSAGGDADDEDVDGAPVFLWVVRPGGQPGATVALTASAPPLPAGVRPGSSKPWTAQIGSHAFRLDGREISGDWLVAGQSMAEETHFQGVLVEGEVLAGPVLLLAVFAGSLIIGLRALAPVELSRRRQLEFTADASHELRTPLSVISAETSIALSSPRDAAGYRATLARIQGEGQRLRTIVEDLLWLARFDSHPPPPDDEPIDLGAIAGECAARFRPVASAESVEVCLAADGAEDAGNGEADAGQGSDGQGSDGQGSDGQGSESGSGGGQAGDGGLAWISAPPDWIDRLAGVLMDNACRYAGPGGRVRISALARGNWVSLVVEDSGPGIPPGDRPRLFDRFHRATEHGSGAGLGLAIGDSIVRSTGGRWKIGESALGGARVEVCWRRAPQPPGWSAASSRSPGSGSGSGGA